MLPAIREAQELYLIEILHQTTTKYLPSSVKTKLYLIEILHQTTTPSDALSSRRWLYLIEILHQTTTNPCQYTLWESCILLKFYIKPQPVLPKESPCLVVSY